MSESNGLNKNQLQNAYQRPVANIYDLYLTGAIGDAKDYQDWNQMNFRQGSRPLDCGIADRNHR